MTPEQIIDWMPFTDEIRERCKKNSGMQKALKLAYPSRFVALGGISTSYSPNKPEDEVIGIYVYDKTDKIVKQDFLVNIGGQYKDFKLYTKLPGRNYTANVQHINSFMDIYGKNGFYLNTHHPELKELPIGIKERAITLITREDPQSPYLAT